MRICIQVIINEVLLGENFKGGGGVGLGKSRSQSEGTISGI